jgi:hypothetical protein
MRYVRSKFWHAVRDTFVVDATDRAREQFVDVGDSVRSQMIWHKVNPSVSRTLRDPVLNGLNLEEQV